MLAQGWLEGQLARRLGLELMLMLASAAINFRVHQQAMRSRALSSLSAPNLSGKWAPLFVG